MRTGPARSRRILTVLAFTAAVVLGAFLVRQPILRTAGGMLVVAGRVAPAEVIVVAIDAGAAGALEAADLVREGIAPRVAVFGDPLETAGKEFARRGLPYEDGAALLIRQLGILGVKGAERISTDVVGTESEGEVLPRWCDEHRLQSIVVVTSADHSRRLGRVLHRSMKNHRTKVVVYPSRYSSFEPDRWWTTRQGLRTGIVESQKLLLDIVLHPIS